MEVVEIEKYIDHHWAKVLSTLGQNLLIWHTIRRRHQMTSWQGT